MLLHLNICPMTLSKRPDMTQLVNVQMSKQFSPAKFSHPQMSALYYTTYVNISLVCYNHAMTIGEVSGGVTTEAYDHVFNDGYWQLEQTVPGLSVVPASRLGKEFLDLVTKFNDGMLRLSDPTPTHEVLADGLTTGTVVMTEAETLARIVVASPSVAGTEVSCGPADMVIDRITSEPSMRERYKRFVTWGIVAPAIGRRDTKAIFPLAVDPARSFSWELARPHYTPALKVTGVRSDDGIRRLGTYETILEEEPGMLYFGRVIRLETHQPLETPTRRPTISSYFRI